MKSLEIKRFFIINKNVYAMYITNWRKLSPNNSLSERNENLNRFFIGIYRSQTLPLENFILRTDKLSLKEAIKLGIETLKGEVKCIQST